MAFVRRMLASLSSIAKFSGQLDQIAKRYETTKLAILWKALQLRFRNGLALQEGLTAGLLASNIPQQVSDVCLSKSTLQRLQIKANPNWATCLTEDKAIFYSFCEGLHLPVPRLYAVFDTYSGWTSDGRTIREKIGWQRFLEEELPEEFVVKPALGAYGHEVLVFERNGKTFLDSNRREFHAEEVLNTIASSSRYSKFLFTERLHSHRDLEVLSNTRYVQTARLVTFVHDQQQADVYLSYLRVIAGDRPVDNIDKGAIGNLVCNIDLESGRLAAGIRIDSDRLGYVKLTHHPRTQNEFEQFTIPMWQNACDLVRRAAVLFLPLRTIGWDVAITPKFPVLVEGNAFYDNFLRVSANANKKQLEKIGELTDLLEACGDSKRS